MGKLITLDDAAKRLVILKHVLRRLISSGNLKAHQINAGVIRVDSADPSGGLLYFPDAPPQWVSAEESRGLINELWPRLEGRPKTMNTGGNYTTTGCRRAQQAGRPRHRPIAVCDLAQRRETGADLGGALSSPLRSGFHW